VVRFLVWVIAAAFTPRVRLMVENLCLRQQLLVLHRRHPQPRLGNADLRFWIIACRWFSQLAWFAPHCETRDGVEVASSGLACLLVVAVASAAGRSGRHPIAIHLQHWGLE
jgi:hypothetical protein